MGERRTWAALLAGLAGVLYLWWPRSNLAWHLRTGTPPQTLPAVAIALFALTGYINARAGAGVHAAADETGLEDLVALTPVPVATVVAGRLTAGALVVLLQLLLGLPFLLASLGVSGVSAAVLPATMAVVGGAALAWRMSALALLLALPEHPVLRDLLLLALSLAYLAATFIAAPAANPLAVLVDLAGGRVRALPLAGASLPFSAVSVIIALFVLTAAAFVSAAALRAARAGKAHEGSNSGRQG
jgi:hypothetical protein